jgi:hypothetical protein
MNKGANMTYYEVMDAFNKAAGNATVSGTTFA